MKRICLGDNYSQLENKIRTYSSVLVLLICIFLLISCAAPAKRALLQTQMGATKQAWETISTEIAHPTVSSQEDLCELHATAVRILCNVVQRDYAPIDADLAAKKSYDYVLKNCGAFKKWPAIAENMYGLYFKSSGRPGMAIPHIKRSQLLSDDMYSTMCNESIIASIYADMGQFELRDFHRLNAIKIGRDYFGTERTDKKSFVELTEFINYENILSVRMGDLSWSEDRSGALPEMYQLWNEIKMMTKRKSEKLSRSFKPGFITASHHFAKAGDAVFARKLLDEARMGIKETPHILRELAQLEWQINEAEILGVEGNYKEAASLWKDSINKYPTISYPKGILVSADMFRKAGLAQESAQDYDLAIEYFEKAIDSFETRRSSFEVRSRGQFLSGQILTAYWGLIRSYAARYLKERNERDFQGALKAERFLRARQFGELTGIDKKGGSDFDISALRLRPDELLLDYVLTDSAIMVFAVSRDWHNIFIIPYDNQFKVTLKRVRLELSAPGDPKDLMNDLQDASNVLLKPLGERLSQVRTLIVIPDGYLNSIPFAILSKKQNQYYPIVKDHQVTLMPSISYMIAQRNSRTQENYDKLLFALADPVYDSRPLPETHRDDTGVFYTRAVNDFKLFTPLPETRIEVENISNALGAGNSTLLLGNNASKANVKSTALRGFRYLHFATHGILGNQIPGINEPALVLAADNSAESSFLTLSEIEELKLNSDLTVLSACDTGSGKYYTGEGVMGLSRGFLIAGSKSVLASLWPIDSKSTVAFMTRFYQHLQSGKAKSVSLRLTQLEFMSGQEGGTSTERGVRIIDKSQQQAEISHPFYWASFVLTGE